MPDFKFNQAAMSGTPLGQIREFVRDLGPVEMELRKDLEAKLIARVGPLSALLPTLAPWPTPSRRCAGRVFQFLADVVESRMKRG